MTTNSDPIVITSAARTPMGGFQGDLSPAPATELGATAIRAAVQRAGVAAEAIDEVIMGCVLPAGQGQAPARQAALGGGLPLETGCTTINKMCGSGMKATMLAHDLINAGTNRIMIAGGKIIARTTSITKPPAVPVTSPTKAVTNAVSVMFQ